VIRAGLKKAMKREDLPMYASEGRSASSLKWIGNMPALPSRISRHAMAPSIVLLKSCESYLYIVAEKVSMDQ